VPVGGVRVHGLRELQQTFKTLDRRLVGELGTELRRAAEPVAEATRELLSEKFDGVSLSTITTSRSGLRVFVRQGAAKVTGKRRDFGLLQLRYGFWPALEENSDEVVERVEDVLNDWFGAEGF